MLSTANTAGRHAIPVSVVRHSAGSRRHTEAICGHSGCLAQLVWWASSDRNPCPRPCGNGRGARGRQVTANMEQLLKSGVLGSPEDALATLLEAFSSMAFDPELVKEGKSVVRLPRLLRASLGTHIAVCSALSGEGSLDAGDWG